VRSTVILPTPTADLALLSDQLFQAWGVTCGEPLVQYLAWSERTGIFSLLAARGRVTAADVGAASVLSEQGADALLCVLAGMGLLCRRPEDGSYALTPLAREYLLPDSPYYAGAGLFLDCEKELPANYLREVEPPPGDSAAPWPLAERLRVQHSRNFAAAVIAARSGEFDGLTHVLDIGGGSGVLAIPLALDHPHLRITLVEWPTALDEIRTWLAAYGVEDRVELVGMNIFEDRWDFPACDGIFFGNIFHGHDDDACRRLARWSYACLSSGGKVWLHEVVFDDNRDGPLLAALWNANMVARKAGAQQRSIRELMQLLQAGGFVGCYSRPTAGRFTLVAGTKAASPRS
jgi:acetylserotonin N-methyltransferase